MKTLHILTIIAINSLIFHGSSMGQCPTPAFTAPDSACKGIPVTITNTSTGSNLSYQWDFNAGDLNYTPVGGLNTTLSNEISASTGVDFMKEGNNYIGFNLKSAFSLVRLEFGNSLTNVPVATNLGDLGGAVASANFDFKLYKEGDQYYALYYNAFSQMTLLSFGTSLLNTPTATPVTLPPGLFQTVSNMDLAKMGPDVVAAIANTGGVISIINFGPSITNPTPTAYNITVPGQFPYTTALLNDCGHFYAYVGHLSGSPFSIIDFGTSITPTPQQILNFTNSTQYAYRKIHVVKEGGRWMLIGNTFSGDLLHTFDLGTNPANVNPTWINHGGIGAFSSGTWTFAIRNIDSEISGFTCNYNTGELNWFKYPQTGNISPLISTSPNPTVTFNDAGKFYYALTITDTITGNSTSKTDSIYISEAPVANFTGSPGCTGAETFFYNTSSGNPIQALWDFGNGQTTSGDTVSNIYATAGSFPTTLIAVNASGCSDTITLPTVVNEKPMADFLFANNPCAGADVTFTDNSSTQNGSIVQRNWNFGSGNTASGFQATYGFPSDGQFPVTLYVEASTGCKDSTTKTVDVIPGPIADFTFNSTCLGAVTNFQNTTQISTGLQVGYLWEFLPGDTTSSISPSFNFPSLQAGDYPVLLTATATNGCIDTITKIIHIGPPANVNFFIDDTLVCSGAIVQFNDSSTIATGETIIQRIWNWGDGNSDSTATSISHAYSMAGNYTVTLEITTAANCIATHTRNIQVIESPTANFSFPNACRGVSIQFTDSSSSSQLSTLVTWKWNFGDTDTAATQNPIHTYDTAGTYTVQLITIDDNGCTDSTQRTIQIYPTPVVNFTNSKACTNNAITFNDSSYVSGASINNWEWNFGDGNSSSGISQVQNTYSLTAAYAVTLIATTTQGCIDSTTRLLPVDYSPSFQLLSSRACFGNQNAFGFVNTGQVISSPGYLWNFGDFTSSFQQQPSHLYNTPGNKTVTFTFTNLANGCAITDTLIAEVVNNPDADFINDSVCIGDTLQLSDNSTSADEPITQWKWSSNLQVTTGSQNQLIPGTAAGVYPVKLLVTTSSGCKDSIVKNVEVFPLPLTSFTPDPVFGSPPLTVNFINNSDPGSYSWNFGDGSPISTTSTPTHIFTDTGSYTISLITTSANGCIDSTSSSIYVLLPYLDLAVLNAKYEETDEYYEVSATVRNTGNITINNFDINVNLQGKSPLTEFIDNYTIQPGNTVNITLNSKLLKDDFSPQFLCVHINKVNDQQDRNAANDETCTAIADSWQVYDVYPNPGDGIFEIPVYAPEETEAILRFYELTGRELRPALPITVTRGFNRIPLALTNEAAGSYIITLEKGDKISYLRLVKR